MQEIMERRFRWNLRQVLAAAAETARAVGEESGPRRTERAFIERRLEALRAFFAAVAAGIGAFAQGKSFAPETVQNVFRLGAPRSGERSRSHGTYPRRGTPLVQLRGFPHGLGHL